MGNEPYPRAARDVVSAFVEIVKMAPERIAVRDRSGVLTYRALDECADRLAHALRSSGVGRGDRVALALDRSADAIIGMLATLKVEAAFMPLDPDAPDAYRQALLRKFAPACILTGDDGPNAQGPHAENVPLLRVGETVGTPAKPLAMPESAPSPAPPAPDLPAYVMFTSGSTGDPKGVVVPHRAIVRLVRRPNYIEIAPDDVFLQLAPLSFDASTFEIWGALLNGATLAIMPPGLPSLEQIADAVSSHRVTTLWLTAGLFHLMVDARPDAFRDLRWLLAGGDVLSPDHVRRALAALPKGRLINGYGPTENTTFSCCWTVPADWLGDDVPIGQPIRGTTAHILDEARQPVPPGKTGELYVGGMGVALGYLDDPSATAQAFLPDPFAEDPGARLYRTGDLVRSDADGLIRFVGRTDDQVKIDGRRVEPGQIEAALLGLPGIRQAAVLPHRRPDGHKELWAFAVVEERARWDASETRRLLGRSLPRHAVPARLTRVPHLPLARTGKIDRRALAALAEQAEAAAGSGEAAIPVEATAEIAAIWARRLQRDAVPHQANFFDLGGTSLLLMAVHADLERAFPGRFRITDLFALPTVAAQAAHLAGRQAALWAPASPTRGENGSGPSCPIAIIGVAGRFPGAPTAEAFWRNLRAGTESIERFAPEEIEDPLGRTLIDDENYVRARSVLEGIEQFDAEFFEFLPSEAALADPQQRLFLEVAWEAFEDAGYDPKAVGGSVAVLAGSSIDTYLLNHLLADPARRRRFTGAYQVGELPALIGNGSDFLATRVAYKLDLRGPAMTVQSACSTSLLAVAQACQCLRDGQADLALAGGVSITLPQRRGYLYQAGGMVSPDGHCRPFDAEAAGTVFGHGAGAVLLKRLDRAIADRDNIHAVILGAGVTNDGAAKVGYAAPSVDGQAEAIARAHAAAGIPPETISYVECHGTGTPLGDPIEIAALTRAFRRGTDRTGFCAIGTAKANIGHLDVAAGVAGLIKTVLSLRHRELPPLLHWRRPNPAIDLSSSPFYVNHVLRPWQGGPEPRRAGVSAFGVGGTNVHLVLEEAPAEPLDQAPSRPQLFILSARSEAALASMHARLADHLEARPEQSLADVAFTLQLGRAGFAHRACHLAEDRTGLVRLLRSEPPARRPAAAPGIAVDCLLPGQGAQHPGMGAGLYAVMPAYRAAIDRCAEILAPHLDLDIRELLLADPGDQAATEQLNTTRLAQPALFSVCWALAQLWASLGVAPGAMIGHSVGELVAATLAGVMPLDDALSLVAARGTAMQALPPGRMLAVRLSELELTAILPAALDMAAVNSSTSCVVAGAEAAIAAFAARLHADGVAHRPLRSSHAFHSRMMDPAVAALEVAARALRLSPPTIPIVSTVTGRWLTDAEATDPGYWARHLRLPVRFSDALATLAAERASALVEVGPGRVLSALALQHGAVPPGRTILASLPDPLDGATDHAAFLEAAGRLWADGVVIDWRSLHGTGRRQRVSLPTYPFERARHWIDAPMDDANPMPFPSANLAAPAAPPIVSAEPPTMPDHAAATESSAPNHVRAMGTALDALRVLVEEVSGIDGQALPAGASFLEMGLDSLLLTQLAQAVRGRFGVEIAFRRLTGDLASIETLAAHLAAATPQSTAAGAALPVEPAVSPPAAVAAAMQPAAPAVLGDPVARLMRDQLQAMQELMKAQLAALGAPAARPVHPASPAGLPATPPTGKEPGPAGAFGPYEPFERGADLALTPTQRTFVQGLIERADRRTAGSKRLADQHRAVLADPRVAAGFRSEWKELVYPLATVRSMGSRIVDVDGNEYVDLLNGFGPTLFGHAPGFVTRAIAEQLERGFEIGPMTPLAGEVAALIREMTGNERVTFCNTGSEAVMAAMRIARTVTGRARIATFAGDYHGQFDEVLIKGFLRDGDPRIAAIAPGIPRESIANMVVLEPGAPASLAWLEAHAGELAAVLVEPVQSRHPAAQNREFLQALRGITERAGAALILDEIVTGFRVHPGGVQALFGLHADLVTYGKVLGGGMPIGVLAGRARFMDALDGGAWRFGDASGPTAGVTFFAGTFVRHPLALAAAGAVLRHLKSEGPALQDRLNRRTAQLVDDLNRVLDLAGAPARVESFGSIFHFKFPPENRFSSLFWHLLRERGVHHQEGFPGFLTTAHDEADLEQVVTAFAGAADAMRTAGCFGEPAAVRPMPILSGRPTEAQMEIWLASQYGPAASCAFNESITLTLLGALDPSALERALRRLVDRHDALRMRFARTGESFEVDGEARVSLALVELASLDPERRAAELETLIAAEAATPFDLVEGPLVRFVLARNIELDTHALVMTAHHIICDGWSTNLLIAELGPLYDAERSGRVDDRPPAPSFAAHAARPPKGAEAAERYWLDAYRTLPEPLELPGDRPRPAERSFRGGTSVAEIDGASLAALKAAGAKHGATLFVTLLAGFSAVLARLSGQDELVVGVPAAGQSALAPGGLVGHCVNFLPIRTMLAPGMRFAELVARTRTTMIEANEHQACTFGTLVRRLGLERSASRLPLIDVQFNLERVGSDLAFADLKVSIEANPKAFVNFDLFLNAVEAPDRLLLQCDYNADLFDPATVDRWLGHYRTLLEAAAADMERPVEALPLMTEAERACVLEMLSGPEVEIPAMPLHELIAAQAARTPGRTALRSGDRSMSYAELEAAAERLAHRIVSAGGAPGMPVGVLAERGIELVVALLAVLKTGAFYVPLDPANPRLRTEFVLADCGARVLVAARDGAAGLGADGLNVVETADDGRPVAARSIPLVPSDALAYRIYTSGSTGHPKGVDVAHRAVVNLLAAMRTAPGIEADDVLFAVTTPSFDIAALELFLPLTIGATVAIARTEEVHDGRLLRAALGSAGATMLQATPSTWRLLIEAGWRPSPALRMLCGGETLPPTLAERLLAGGGELWNMYGPTETTIWSAVERIQAADDITLDRPIANTRFLILDKALRPLPPGIPGELAITGAGLARGYHDRPDLTAVKFTVPPEPVAGRLYRTGDRARLRADGRLELLGRQDDQVKLRGYRIELGEIEAVLSRAAGGAHAAAMLARPQGRDPFLVGFVESGTGVIPDPESLRGRLTEELPDWMVPARIVMLDALPLTANGKLDRKALPVPDAPAVPRPMPAPARTPTERTLLAIWQDVLARPEIGTTDDLFALGADSIQAFQIVARADRAGLSLDAAMLLRHRTVERLASALGGTPTSPPEAPDRIRRAARRAFRIDMPAEHGSTGDGAALP
jgi:amino acid adenylation domain-containing protein